MVGRFAPEREADFLTNAPDIGQVEVAIELAWGAHANERQFRLTDRLDRVAGGAQPAHFDSVCYDFADICFNDGRSPTVDQINFGR